MRQFSLPLLRYTCLHMCANDLEMGRIGLKVKLLIVLDTKSTIASIRLIMQALITLIALMWGRMAEF